METNMMRFYFIENVTSRHEGLCGGMALFTTYFPRIQSWQAQISVKDSFLSIEA
jgi:hypothetical protein